MFQLIYGQAPLELNASTAFMQANYAIRGTQMLAYMMDKKFQGNKMKINNFFEMASECLHSTGMCMKMEYMCDEMAKMYRNLDGSCNNLEKPELGAAMTEYSRLLPPEYDDSKIYLKNYRFSRNILFQMSMKFEKISSETR